MSDVLFFRYRDDYGLLRNTYAGIFEALEIQEHGSDGSEGRWLVACDAKRARDGRHQRAKSRVIAPPRTRLELPAMWRTGNNVTTGILCGWCEFWIEDTFVIFMYNPACVLQLRASKVCTYVEPKNPN